MNLAHLLNARCAAGSPVNVALIGAGKFGSMFLSQVPHTPGLEVPVIVDLDRERARGLPHGRLGPSKDRSDHVHRRRHQSDI